MTGGHATKKDDGRFLGLFMECPISLWEEDITDLVAYLDTLRSAGIVDIRAHLAAHPDEVARCAGSVRIVAVNKATLELYEAPDEQSLYEGLHTVFTGESLDAFRGIVIALFEGKHRYETEGINRTLSGKRLRVHLKLSLLPDSKGNLTRALVSVMDLTERDKAEEEARKWGEVLEKTFSGLDSALFILNNGQPPVIMECNLSASRVFGYRREELLGQTTSFLHVSADALAEFQKANWSAIADHGYLSSYEFRMRRKNGEVFPSEHSVYPLLDDHGARTGWVSVVRDITERKKAESDRELFRNLINRSSDAIFVNDPLTGRFIDMNERACSSLGYGRDELLKMSVKDIEGTFPDDRAWRDHMADVKRRGSLHLEGMHKKRDGTAFPVEISVSYVVLGTAEYMIAVVRDISERKQADAALRERERLLAESQRIAHIGSWEHNLKTGQAFWSDELFRMLGLDPRKDPADFTMFFKMVHPDDQPEVKKAIDATLREKRPFSMAYRFVLRDGTTRIIDAQAELIPDESGEPVILSGTAQDITERKRQEQALQKSEKMLQTIIDAEPECVKVLDENACLIMMNRAGLDMLQVESLDAVKGTCVCPLVTSEYRDAFMDLTKRVFRGESGTLLFEMIGMRGRRLWLETHAVPLRDEKNEISALLGVTRDVTERKRAEEELRDKEEKYRVLFESANDGIFIQDETGFTDCNQKGAEMYGLRKEEIIGHSPSEFAPERQPDGRLSSEVAGGKIRAALSGAPQVFAWQALRADGSPFDVEITLSRLELGGRVCLQAIVRDISVRKRLEQELLKTQKLESVGTLAGGIAHDFNNLLQGVFGYISMARLSLGQKERAAAMLEQAEKALHQSVNLTTQLLTFSKGGKPVKKRVLLGPVIENGVRFALSGSQLNYRIDLAPDLQTVEADEGQIGQVIHNIVLNGDQAMPLGGRIEIEARNVPASSPELPPGLADTAHVRISIRDSGTGIPAEYLPRIFDPYFTTKEKGSGLGLATSYSIVRNHGGMITVSSEPGKGSVFTIFLPACGPAPEDLSRDEAPARPLPGRILVMDDEEVVRMVAEELLHELGHEVLCTADGAAAIDAYRCAREAGRPYDIVILDLTIRGGIGGLETLQRLQEIDPAVRAVVSSGYSDDEVVSDFRKYGFSGFLKKPYDLTALREALSLLMP